MPARKPALLPVLSAGALCLTMARVPDFAPVLLPLRLLTTLIHESGHAVATLLTGGRVAAITISPDGSGLTLTDGGFRPLILSAGYLSSTLVGCALLLASRDRRLATALLWALGGAIAAITFMFASNTLTWIMGLFWGLALALWAAKGPRETHPFVLAILGIQGSLNAFSDLLALVTISAGSETRTDALLASREMCGGSLSPLVWAVLWAAFSLVATVLTLRRLLRST